MVSGQTKPRWKKVGFSFPISFFWVNLDTWSEVNVLI